jgi:hypothetical protein
MVYDTIPSRKNVFDSVRARMDSSRKKFGGAVIKEVKSVIPQSIGFKKGYNGVKKDSAIKKLDTLVKSSFSAFSSANFLKLKNAHVVDLDRFSGDETYFKSKDSLHLNDGIIKIVKPKTWLSFNGGYLAYDFSYRSIVDTPFAQKNFNQHTASGFLKFSVANSLPIRVSYLIRNGNSNYFKDIYDVRVELDVLAYRNQLADKFGRLLSDRLNHLRDSVSELAYYNKISEIKQLKEWLDHPFTRQKLYEMNEIVRMPSITYDRMLPDSLARIRSDSMQSLARTFLDLYQEEQIFLAGLERNADSLKIQYEKIRNEIEQLKGFVHGNYHNWSSFKNWASRLRELSDSQIVVPKKYEWLLGVRDFSIGRSQLNHSELTARNIGLSGLNFEYNSWYYLAVSAGLVDYRFRDFSFPTFHKAPQYLYMVRLGVGELDRNYIIGSVLKGQKQLYSSGALSKGTRPVDVSVLSIETKYRFARNTFIIAEAAQSFTNGYYPDSVTSKKFFNIADHSNKALSIKLYSLFPRPDRELKDFTNTQEGTINRLTAFNLMQHLIAGI